MIRVLLVDDQLAVRQGWRMRLAIEADVTVVGEADNGQRALEMASKLRPDVIIMDVAMPLMDGITATEQLQRQASNAAIVIMSIHDDAEVRARALAAGAAAFIGKQEPIQTLIAAIRRFGGERQRGSLA